MILRQDRPTLSSKETKSRLSPLLMTWKVSGLPMGLSDFGMETHDPLGRPGSVNAL